MNNRMVKLLVAVGLLMGNSCFAAAAFHMDVSDADARRVNDRAYAPYIKAGEAIRKISGPEGQVCLEVWDMVTNSLSSGAYLALETGAIQLIPRANKLIDVRPYLPNGKYISKEVWGLQYGMGRDYVIFEPAPEAGPGAYYMQHCSLRSDPAKSYILGIDALVDKSYASLSPAIKSRFQLDATIETDTGYTKAKSRPVRITAFTGTAAAATPAYDTSSTGMGGGADTSAAVAAAEAVIDYAAQTTAALGEVTTAISGLIANDGTTASAVNAKIQALKEAVAALAAQ